MKEFWNELLKEFWNELQKEFLNELQDVLCGPYRMQSRFRYAPACRHRLLSAPIFEHLKLNSIVGLN